MTPENDNCNSNNNSFKVNEEVETTEKIRSSSMDESAFIKSLKRVNVIPYDEDC